MGQTQHLVERPISRKAGRGPDLVATLWRFRAFLVLYVVVSVLLVIVLGIFHDAKLSADGERPSPSDAPAGTAE